MTKTGLIVGPFLPVVSVAAAPGPQRRPVRGERVVTRRAATQPRVAATDDFVQRDPKLARADAARAAIVRIRRALAQHAGPREFLVSLDPRKERPEAGMKAMSQSLHPDRLSGQDPSLLAAAEEAQQTLSSAMAAYRHGAPAALQTFAVKRGAALAEAQQRYAQEREARRAEEERRRAEDEARAAAERARRDAERRTTKLGRIHEQAPQQLADRDRLRAAADQLRSEAPDLRGVYEAAALRAARALQAVEASAVRLDQVMERVILGPGGVEELAAARAELEGHRRALDDARAGVHAHAEVSQQLQTTVDGLSARIAELFQVQSEVRRARKAGERLKDPRLGELPREKDIYPAVEHVRRLRTDLEKGAARWGHSERLDAHLTRLSAAIDALTARVDTAERRRAHEFSLRKVTFANAPAEWQSRLTLAGASILRAVEQSEGLLADWRSSESEWDHRVQAHRAGRFMQDTTPAALQTHEARAKTIADLVIGGRPQVSSDVLAELPADLVRRFERAQDEAANLRFPRRSHLIAPAGRHG